MDTDLRRRAFLTGIVACLIGAPFGMRYFGRRNRSEIGSHPFSDNLKKYEALLEQPIREIAGTSPFTLALTPPQRDEWKYVLLSSSYFPDELSQAVEGEPDTFLVREGQLFLDRTQQGQVVITGGDTLFQVVSPVGTEDHQGNTVTLLVDADRLRFAKAKDAGENANLDRQFRHLLALESRPDTALAVGGRWQSDRGRIKPFRDCPTNYTVDGFSEITGRRTVRIGFAGTAPDIAAMPDVSDVKLPESVSMTSKNTGTAWFDLETSFLVRQSVETETTTWSIIRRGNPAGSTGCCSTGGFTRSAISGSRTASCSSSASRSGATWTVPIVVTAANSPGSGRTVRVPCPCRSRNGP